MKRRYILEEWNAFATGVLPKNVSDVQRREMRRAFYAGAHSILYAIMRVLSPGSDDVTATDLEIMQSIEAEATAFAEDIKAGRA